MNNRLCFSRRVIQTGLANQRRPFTIDANQEKPKSKYDALVIGGGHNGLVAAAYLGKAGKKVAVLERRHIIGGAAVTEEIIPDFQISRASYLLSLLRPTVINDLELKKHGLRWHRKDPVFFSPIRGTKKSLLLGSDMHQNQKEIAKFSNRDAENYPKYEHWMGDICQNIENLMDIEPTDLSNSTQFETFKKLRQLYKIGRPLGYKGTLDLYDLLTSPISKIMNRWFESDVMKATLATDAVVGFCAGPYTPGGGYTLLHHVMGGVDGHQGVWAIVLGGMGAVSDACAKAAIERGAEIFVNASVDRIVTDVERTAKGVKLASGQEIHADLVFSNATPKVTFLDLMHSVDLPRDFRASVGQIDYESPVTKLNVALKALPNFTAVPNMADNQPMPHHQTTLHLNCESMQLVHDAYLDFAAGKWSDRPFIEMTIPSSVDGSLAPDGCHVCTLFTQYTPYTLKDGRVWDPQTMDAYAKQVFSQIEEYAPGFESSVLGYEVLPPPELERIFGLTGGNIMHGSMTLDQLFWSRPLPGHANYKTPIKGLYLCGSGTHPGGGVTGSPGRLAALRALQDN